MKKLVYIAIIICITCFLLAGCKTTSNNLVYKTSRGYSNAKGNPLPKYSAKYAKKVLGKDESKRSLKEQESACEMIETVPQYHDYYYGRWRCDRWKFYEKHQFLNKFIANLKSEFNFPTVIDENTTLIDIKPDHVYFGPIYIYKANISSAVLLTSFEFIFDYHLQNERDKKSSGKSLFAHGFGGMTWKYITTDNVEFDITIQPKML